MVLLLSFPSRVDQWQSSALPYSVTQPDAPESSPGKISSPFQPLPRLQAAFSTSLSAGLTLQPHLLTTSLHGAHSVATEGHQSSSSSKGP